MGFTLGVLVTVTTGGGGGGAEIRVTKTVKALRKERLFRPPSGAPVTALMLTVFSSLVAAAYFQPRPQLITYVGVTAVTWACLSY